MAGGAGFIGSHLCARLLAAGHSVLCVDNFITGSRANVEGLRDAPGFTLREQDVCALEVGEQVDAVYHLASPASPVGYTRHPLETALANSAGTQRLLELATAAGARLLLASTSEIYGDPLVHPQPETYWGNVSSIGPRACYDESKRYGEMLTTVFRRLHGTDARIVRIFNTYGPHSDPLDGRLVPNLITQALRGQPLTVYGDGQQTRSLCYVDDLVAGLVAAMDTPGTDGQVINLGNPDERSVLEIARIIHRLAGASADIVFTPQMTGDDPHRRCPDIGQARRLLGWNPTVDLEPGLTRTVAWMRVRLFGGG